MSNPNKPRTYEELRFQAGQGCGSIMLFFMVVIGIAAILHVPVTAVVIVLAVVSIGRVVWKGVRK